MIFHFLIAELDYIAKYVYIDSWKCLDTASLVQTWQKQFPKKRLFVNPVMGLFPGSPRQTREKLFKLV